MTTKTQLGFCEPIESEEQWRHVSHRSVAWWSDWDGGQVGGRPSWLNPKEVPTAVHCTICQDKNTPMHFVCQLYAPLDNDQDECDQSTASTTLDAFHRSLYVFACPNMTKHPDPTTTGLRVLRTQLPRNNPYWPLEENDVDNHDTTTTTTTWPRHKAERYHKNGMCFVCGFPATGRCPLQQQSFCGPAHQKLSLSLYKKRRALPDSSNCGSRKDDTDNKTGNSKSQTITTTQSNLPGVYNMLELVVEEEPPLPSIEELNEKDGITDKSAPLYPTIDDGDSDDDLDQDDLNRIVTGRDSNSKKRDDTTYQRFIERWTERPDCKDQVLRYCRWPKDDASGKDDDDDDVEYNGPLWIRSDHQPDNIPACPYCGAERKFEFQLMPQMLNYLTNHVITGATSSNDQPEDYESVKAALQQADSLVQQAPPEQVPPALIEAKNAAVARLRNQLLHRTKATLDWGVVAVYTCTQSCSTTSTLVTNDEGQANGAAATSLGAYREEFTWRQPAIDDDNV